MTCTVSRSDPATRPVSQRQLCPGSSQATMFRYSEQNRNQWKCTTVRSTSQQVLFQLGELIIYHVYFNH